MPRIRSFIYTPDAAAPDTHTAEIEHIQYFTGTREAALYMANEKIKQQVC
jgi:hypothetical protein